MGARTMKPEDIQQALHRNLDRIPVPDRESWMARAMGPADSRQRGRWNNRPRWVGLALTSAAVVGGLWLGSQSHSQTHIMGPRFIGTASVVNLAMPYLTQHNVDAIHVPTFLPFTVATSLKPRPAMVPIVRAGTGTLPKLLSSPSLDGRHAIYWIAISSQGASLPLAEQISNQSTIARLIAEQKPWVVMVASHGKLFDGGTNLKQGLFRGRYWTAADLGWINQVSNAQAISWAQGTVTYTIVVTDQSVTSDELVWLARTMASTTLHRPEAFALVYRSLVEPRHGKAQLDTWVVSATPYHAEDKMGYHTHLSESHVLLTPDMLKRDHHPLLVVLPKPKITARIPVLLPDDWPIFGSRFYAGVSYQFNPGGYHVSWFKTMATVSLPYNAPPSAEPFLTVTAGDLVTTMLAPTTHPAISLASYRDLVQSSTLNTPIADWVQLGSKTLWISTQLLATGPVATVEFSYQGSLYQVASPSLWHALSATAQMLRLDVKNL